MQTKYYLSFEQVGIIRRIPLKEQDPDMQGILDAFIKAFRIANELGDEEEVTTPDLINSLNHIDDIYIDAFYKQEVTREVKPFKKKKPSYQS